MIARLCSAGLQSSRICGWSFRSRDRGFRRRQGHGKRYHAGAILQNVAVAIEDTGRGVRRTATTDSAGQYLITGLSPAIYQVKVAMPGFGPQVNKNVVLDVGETLILDFRMKV